MAAVSVHFTDQQQLDGIATDLLLDFAKDHDGDLAAAAVALGQISDPRAAKHLASYIHDKDSRVREIARNALDSSTSSDSASNN